MTDAAVLDRISKVNDDTRITGASFGPAGYVAGLMSTVLSGLEADQLKDQYFYDPVKWARDHLGIELWWKQCEIAYSIALGDKKSIAVRAGHGVGKSFLSAVLVCWWIDTRPHQFTFVATTAPSADQVSAILWREIRKMHQLSADRHKMYQLRVDRGEDPGTLPDHRLPGRITGRNEWKLDDGTLIAQGRKPPDHKEDAFQGIHAEYVLAIGDEAVGLNEGMIDSLQNITTGINCRRLLIANPTNPNSRLGEIFAGKVTEDGTKISDAWSLHHISVLDSPNFHGGDKCDCHPGQPLGLGLDKQALAALVDESYVHDKKLEYGEDSPRYKSRVLGEFAFDDANVLFTEYDIAKAKDATCYVDDNARVILGIDVARGEQGDYTYIYSASSGVMYELDDETGVPLSITDIPGVRLRYVDRFRGVPLVDRKEKDGTETVGQATLIHQHAIELGAREVRVDASNLGIGLIDALITLSYGASYDVIEMRGGETSPDLHAWLNNRAFQLDQMRQRFRLGSIDIDPTDLVMIDQLESITYELVDPHGAMQIEGKAKMRSRGLKSPDAADASWYATADLAHLEKPQDGDVVPIDPDELALMAAAYDPFPF